MMPETRGRWWAEDGDDSWDLYYSGTDEPKAIVHGYKIIKAPKHGTPYAEYWPDADDTAFIVSALNNHISNREQRAWFKAEHDRLMDLAEWLLNALANNQDKTRKEMAEDLIPFAPDAETADILRDIS